MSGAILICNAYQNGLETRSLKSSGTKADNWSFKQVVWIWSLEIPCDSEDDNDSLNASRYSSSEVSLVAIDSAKRLVIRCTGE